MILDQWISVGEPHLEYRIVRNSVPEFQVRTLGHVGDDGWRREEYNFQGDLLARILELKNELRFYGVME